MVFDDNHSLWSKARLTRSRNYSKSLDIDKFRLSSHTPMQDPETVCNTKQTLMSSLNLQEEKLSLAEECSTGEQER